MDIRIFSESSVFPSSRLDSSDVLGDSISSVDGLVNATTGIRDTEGLVTHFFVEPIPEPGSLTLLGPGLAGWLLRWRIRNWR